MMHPYQLHSLGSLYYEEALRKLRCVTWRMRESPQQAALGGAGALVPARQAGRR
jgi:hypothetical protein